LNWVGVPLTILDLPDLLWFDWFDQSNPRDLLGLLTDKARRLGESGRGWGEDQAEVADVP
jgi:hypothetical protein